MLRRLAHINNKYPLIVLVLMHASFLLSLFVVWLECNHETERASKCQDVIVDSASLSKSFYDAALAIGAYSLTRNEMFAERYEKISIQIPRLLSSLEEITQAQHNDKVNILEIKNLVNQGSSQLTNAKSFLSTNQISPFGDSNSELRKLYKQLKITADQLQSKLDNLSTIEQEISNDIPRRLLLMQVLLAFTLIVYASYNLNMQYKLTKIISVIVSPKEQ